MTCQRTDIPQCVADITHINGIVVVDEAEAGPYFACWKNLGGPLVSSVCHIAYFHM